MRRRVSQSASKKSSQGLTKDKGSFWKSKVSLIATVGKAGLTVGAVQILEVRSMSSVDFGRLWARTGKDSRVLRSKSNSLPCLIWLWILRNLVQEMKNYPSTRLK